MYDKVLQWHLEKILLIILRKKSKHYFEILNGIYKMLYILKKNPNM